MIKNFIEVIILPHKVFKKKKKKETFLKFHKLHNKAPVLESLF